MQDVQYDSHTETFIRPITVTLFSSEMAPISTSLGEEITVAVKWIGAASGMARATGLTASIVRGRLKCSFADPFADPFADSFAGPFADSLGVSLADSFVDSFGVSFADSLAESFAGGLGAGEGFS